MPAGQRIYRFRFVIAFAMSVLGAQSARAAVTQVVIGVTPSCPYGISACWSGAYGVLGGLDGVTAVAKTPDAYNCTAQVQTAEEQLPDAAKWEKQFKSRAGNTYGYRGVEVSVTGTVAAKGDQLILTWPGINRPIRLGPLEHKLQYNFRKKQSRQPEADESRAFAQLSAQVDQARSKSIDVELTGTLNSNAQDPVIEVREFYPLTAP